MRYLFDHWPTVETRLRNAGLRLLLFDYDGCLTAIKSRPSLARLPGDLRKRLRTLAHLDNAFVGVVSGRALRNVRRLVGLRNVLYVGNHGLEIANGDLGFVHPLAETRKRLLQNLVYRLRNKLKRIPGAWVENKGLTLSVHYRLVKPIMRREFFRTVEQCLSSTPHASQLLIRHGKCVVDIGALHWNKGSAIVWLLKTVAKGAMVLYLGDDATDEDAFRVLRRYGVTIRVGRSKKSRAAYYLRKQNEVPELLHRLSLIRTEQETAK